MKLYGVRVFVRDWERACAFYGDVLGLPLRFKDAAVGWAEFDVGGPVIGVERVDPEGDAADPERLVGRFVGISLEVDDIAATYQRLRRRGVSFRSPPQRQPWGGVLAHLEDPEGNVLTLLG